MGTRRRSSAKWKSIWMNSWRKNSNTTPSEQEENPPSWSLWGKKAKEARGRRKKYRQSFFNRSQGKIHSWKKKVPWKHRWNWKQTQEKFLRTNYGIVRRFQISSKRLDRKYSMTLRRSSLRSAGLNSAIKLRWRM